MVICKICGYQGNKLLGNHLRSAHKITSNMYLDMFPGSEVCSKEWSNMMSERNKSDRMRGATSERNKSEESRKRISERNKDPDFKKKCKEGLNRPDVKKAMSERMTDRNKNNWKDPEYREHMRSKISESQKKVMNDPDRKLLQSKIMKRYFEDNPDFVERFISSPTKSWKTSSRGTYRFSRFDKEFKYKSIGELEFMMICDSVLDISDISYEKVHIKKYIGGTYTPDFLLTFCDGSRYMIEIKFSESFENYLDEIIPAIDYCYENNIKFCYIRRFPDLKNFTESTILDEFVLCRVNKQGELLETPVYERTISSQAT